MGVVPSEDVAILTANFKFRNRSTCSKGQMKRAGKVCGNSQDLKSPGSYFEHFALSPIHCFMHQWPFFKLLFKKRGFGGKMTKV